MDGVTDIEQKALSLVREVLNERNLSDKRAVRREVSPYTEALCRAIEQHEAFRHEVSDEVKEYTHEGRPAMWVGFDCFIIPAPKPDPLIIEAREICARVCEGWLDTPPDRANQYRKGAHDDEADFAYVLEALRAARGLQIVESE